MINFVIPMAGRGERFARAGYSDPKFMVRWRGRTLMEHALSSLPIGVDDRVILIALERHRAGYDIEGIAGRAVPGRVVVTTVAETTRGQAETVLLAEPLVDPSEDLVIFNIDTGFRSARLRSVLESPARKADGVLGAFVARAGEEQWSFARVGESGAVLETAEKRRISDLALTGLYHFTRGGDFFRVARAHVADDRRSGGEFYVAPMYNDLIARGGRFVLDLVDELIPMGTPEDLVRGG